MGTVSKLLHLTIEDLLSLDIETVTHIFVYTMDIP